MMQGGIYLLQDNGQLVDMKAQAYDSEALLQELLATYPRLLLRGIFRPVAVAVIVHICPGHTLLRGPTTQGRRRMARIPRRAMRSQTLLPG